MTKKKCKCKKTQDSGFIITGSVALAALLTGALTGASGFAVDKLLNQAFPKKGSVN